ncbi:MAG: hypothetical protein JWO11_3504 [Nocardioides sp.]|nr:hypothetical protein [Nocardioides sp.]
MIERQCAVCATPFTTYPSLNKRYCSKACFYIGKRKPDSEYNARYRMVTIAANHPLATKRGNRIPEHRLVLWDAIGAGPHVCHKCGTRVTWITGVRTAKGALVVDHLDRDTHNNAPSNLAPSCHGCNILNRAYTVEDHEDYSLNAVGNRVRGERRDCGRCGASFVAWPDARPGRGLFCSRSCARSTPRVKREV